MRIKNILAAVAASSLVAAPGMAAPVAANPAKSLSVAGARAGTPSKGGEKLGGGGGFFGLAILAGVIAIVVIAVVDSGDSNDNADSN